MSKAKKLAEKMLKAIEFEPAPLSTNKGRIMDSPESRHISKKDKRDKGRVKIYFDDPDYPIYFVYWNEWSSYNDGQRNRGVMIKNIYPQIYWNEDLFWNKKKEIEKIRKHEKIRKLRRLVKFK